MCSPLSYPVIKSFLTMDLKQVAKATAKTLVSYITYEAMRVVVDQLGENNPPLSMWLTRFSTSSKLQDGRAYIQELLSVNQELAFRIMTVRQHIADEIADFLPEMARTSIQEENMKLRCQHLERIVSFSEVAESEIPLTEQISEPEPEN